MKSLAYYKNYLFHRGIKHFLQRWPRLYRQIQLFRYRNTKNYNQIVSPDSDILIEGYPRSANSFATRAFRVANGEGYKIATHLHVYTHVLLGIRYKVPTLVLIRHPYDCVISYATMMSNMKGRENYKKNYSVKWLLDDYVLFYKRLKPYEGKFKMTSFTQISTDYGKVMESLNSMYGCNFIPFNHTKENVQTVFSLADSYLSPSAERDALKEMFTQNMNELKGTSTYKEACELYEYWVNKV